ncbi:MAG: lycopene cyclase domain-containing protein [Flavobacteriaceae bacterium]
MDSLYLWLNLGSFSIPFLYSFHPKLKLYKKWKYMFPAIGIMMLFFIPWDIVFTANGYWGFNPKYLTGLYIVNLPIEEWLFFICIPYACIFTHYALLYYFPNMQLPEKATTRLTYLLVLSMAVLVILFHDRWYPVINYGYAIVLLALVLRYEKELLQKYYLTFLVMLIPFFIVNGVLTGSFIEEQVVWYDNSQNLSVRLFTIPVEDSIYAFTMILTPLVITEYWVRKKSITK